MKILNFFNVYNSDLYLWRDVLHLLYFSYLFRSKILVLVWKEGVYRAPGPCSPQLYLKFHRWGCLFYVICTDTFLSQKLNKRLIGWRYVLPHCRQFMKIQLHFLYFVFLFYLNIRKTILSVMHRDFWSCSSVCQILTFDKRLNLVHFRLRLVFL